MSTYANANDDDATNPNKLNTNHPSDMFDDNISAAMSPSDEIDELCSSCESNDDGDDDNDNDEEEAVVSLEELLYSASSFHAIARPVFVTMVLASLSAVYINNESTIENGARDFAAVYQVWTLDSDSEDSSTWKNLLMSIANTLVMVTGIGGMTFGIVLLYKYRYMKCLIGYMIMSSASLLGFLGHYMATIAIEIYRIPIDVITYYSSLYNFAIVGIIAIFYQQGVPSSITQTYLVITSVILAWHLSHFDEWTAWTLLVMLAFYDLCAVLTPCGPLKALVNLMQEDDSPDMPGLLYEAQLPAGTQRPGGNASAYSPPSTTTSTNAATTTNATTTTLHHNDDKKRPSTTTPTTLSSPLTKNNLRLSIPLALAKVYKLKLVSSYGTGTSTSTVPIDNTSTISSSSFNSTTAIKRSFSRRKFQQQQRRGDGVLNPSPLLADYEQSSSSKKFYDRKFSVRELTSDVEVEMPHGGGRIEKRPDKGMDTSDLKEGESCYTVVGRDGVVKRVLVVNRRGKVYELQEEEDSDSDDGDEEDSVEEGAASIRLGLGDFIFYSLLVAKAALYSFTTFAACILVIMAGLGGTLLMLSVYQSALPALPISIFFGVTFYLLTRLVIEPWIEVVLNAPLYV